MRFSSKRVPECISNNPFLTNSVVFFLNVDVILGLPHAFKSPDISTHPFPGGSFSSGLFRMAAKSRSHAVSSVGLDFVRGIEFLVDFLRLPELEAAIVERNAVNPPVDPSQSSGLGAHVVEVEPA